MDDLFRSVSDIYIFGNPIVGFICKCCDRNVHFIPESSNPRITSRVVLTDCSTLENHTLAVVTVSTYHLGTEGADLEVPASLPWILIRCKGSYLPINK